MKKLLLTLTLLISAVSFGQTVEEYFESGYYKAEAKDFYGAIADYTKAIELNPNYAFAYRERGYSKHYLKNYSGAISDYTKAIELNPNYTDAYSNRGLSKYYINDLNGACEDAKKAISLGNEAWVEWVSDNCN